MIITDVISTVDELKPNQYQEQQKKEWIQELEERITKEIVDTHEQDEMIYQTYDVYEEESNLDPVLQLPARFKNIYVLWVCAKIDFFNAEFERYNNTITMFNSEYSEFAKEYNRTHMPKQLTRYHL